MRDSTQALRPDAVAIFLFHGVLSGETVHPVRNHMRKHLARETFIAVLRGLVAHGTALRFEAALAALAGAEPLPPRAFVVTFDDGFENNARVAAPILADFAVPATFYVTTGFVDDNRASWTDRIEAAMEAAPEVNLPGWPRVARTDEKIALMGRIRALVKGDPAIDPEGYADEVCAALGAQPAFDPDLDQKLSWAQVQALARDPLFTVGGHGHTHRVLARLSPGRLADELDLSLAYLRFAAKIDPVRHYSYPEGQTHDYSGAVIDALRTRGIVAAPTAMPGLNRVGADPFHLRRIMVTT